MEIHYKREMKRNYLVVEPSSQMHPGYEAQMLLNNAVEGLLRFHIKYMDERQSYYYEITSMQPLARILDKRFVKREEIVQLLLQIHAALGRMEAYLLCEDRLLLDAEYVYVEPERFRVGLCLVPGREESFPEQLSGLLQYLMKRADHRDRDCVVLAYGLYQESLKENYGMDDLLKLLSGKETPSEKTQEELEENGSWEENAWEEETVAEHTPQKREILPDLQKNARKTRAGPIVSFWAVGIAVPVMIWLVRGTNACLRIAPFWLMLWLIGGGVLFARKIFREKWEKQETDNSDRTNLEKEEVRDTRRAKTPIWEVPEEPPESEPANVPGDLCTQETAKAQEFQTQLLTPQQKEGTGHRLQGLIPADGDIAISYFPFVIGKYPDLVDYALERPTVSRLHVRIDRTEEGFTVTDLNSTNGTMVDGKLLEANETVPISPGDILYIADIGYTFM